MNFYVISYDIPSDKRRNRTAKILENFATRVQYSVFEANLDEKDFRNMQERLAEILNLEEDKIRFYRLCQNCLDDTETWGKSNITIDPNYYMV